MTALEKIPKELATIAKTHYRSGTMVAVYFFGSHDFSLVSIDALKPFSSNWDTFHDKNTTRRFTVALEEARDIVSHKSLLNKGNSSLDLSTQPESKSKKKTVKKVPTEKRSTKNQSSSENSMYNDNSTANNSFIKSKISSKRRPQSIRDLKIAADGSASVEYLKYCRHKLQKILLRPQPKPREMSICKKILVDLNATPVSVPGLYATNLARVLRLYLDKAGDGRQSTQDDFLTKEVHDLVTKILSDWQHTVIDYIAQVGL